ncbi:MAG: tRNA pseudouridine(38-40) synthase TruA [Clostridia bacterium]|nr:tRNA pseudouridine(38-40) synthase TruA [Clostridia bacterium]
MRNIALTIEYCGTDYCGWQIQDSDPTVQAVVERALSELCKEDIHVTGCSRTDSGVHAVNFVLNFRTAGTIPADRFPAALSSFLPGDVAVKSAEEVPESFHARFDAKFKTYRYYFYIAPLPSAMLWKRSWHVKLPALDTVPENELTASIEKLGRAAEFFTGTHDFSAFRAEGSNVRSTVRTITSARVFAAAREHGQEHPELCFEVRGNGFLYNMVRIMAGTLIDVYKGKLSPEDIPDIISSRDRTKAGMTAPPDGLYLYKVEY